MSYIGNPDTPDSTWILATGTTITGHQVVIPNTSPTNPDDFEVLVSDAATTFPLGVAQVDDISGNSETAGNQVTVRTYGVTKARAAKAVSVGDHLAPTATGLVTNTAPGAGKWFVGVALTSAAQLGDEILMLLKQEVDEA